MNGYLKEIADLCGITSVLNTHKARRTFGSTVTLNNNVPINVVKEMLGHSSVKQTEEYAMTEQQSIGREMKRLQDRLNTAEPSLKNTTSADLAEATEWTKALEKPTRTDRGDKSEFRSVLRVCR